MYNLLLIIFFLLLSALASAQTKTKSSFPIELKNGFSGLATYQYEDKENEEIKNGRFIFTGEKTKGVPCNYFSQFNAKGNYSNNLKNGLWTYSLSQYLIAIEDVVQHQPKATATGSKITLQANYKNGKANGKWVVSQEKAENSKAIPALSSTQAQFISGYFTGKFTQKASYKGMPYSISGEFDKEGFMHGNWIIEYYSNDKIKLEKRIYQNGFLLEITLQEKGNSKEISTIRYDDVRTYLNTLTKAKEPLPAYKIGEDRFDLIFDNGYPEESEKRRAQLRGNEFLSYAFGIFTEDEMMFYQISGESPIVAPATRRFVYEFTPSEQDTLLQVAELTDSICSQVKEFLKNSSFKLNHKQSDSLAFVYELLQEILEKTILVQEELDRIQSPEFKIVDPENYYANGIQNLPSMLQIEYEFGDKSHRKQIELVSIENGKAIAAALYRYTEKLESTLRSFHPFLDRAFAQFGKEKEIELAEIRIVELLDELAALYMSENSVSADGNILPHSLFAAVYSNLAMDNHEKRMEEYLDLGSLELKKTKAKEILTGLEITKQIHPYLKEIVQLRKTLDEAFTHYTYNPYTGKNDLKERAKKRLYQKAVEELLPALIKGLGCEKSPEKVLERTNEIILLNQKLLELVKLPDSETRKLEKKIRKETDIERMKRLLDI